MGRYDINLIIPESLIFLCMDKNFLEFLYEYFNEFKCETEEKLKDIESILNELKEKIKD